jgi:hypothetical protein
MKFYSLCASPTTACGHRHTITDLFIHSFLRSLNCVLFSDAVSTLKDRLCGLAARVPKFDSQRYQSL